MFSFAAAIGIISLVLLLGFASYILRQLGAAEVARWLVAAALFCLAAALIGAAI